MWSLGTFSTGSMHTSMQVWCLSSRDLAWAWWPPSSLFSVLGPIVPVLIITSILPPWPVVLWPGKCVRGFFWLTFSWAHCTLSCCQSSSGYPSCTLGNLASPSLGGFLVSLWASCAPQGRRFFNTTWGVILGMSGPARTVDSFYLGVVFGEGFYRLGVLGAPSSFILETSSYRASWSHLSSPNCLW